MTKSRLPPGQQLTARGKWPLVGERHTAPMAGPWVVAVEGCVEQPARWTLDELCQLPQVERTIDIHCVTRWTMLDARFTGVPLSRLLDVARPTREARFVSFVAHGPRQHSTSLSLPDALRLDTLVALGYDGLPLAAEHGGPVRTVVPRRYFYKSVKWLTRIELLREDRLGFWEGTAGYHNHGDPWQEQRFIAASISKQDASRILAGRDLAGRELLGLDASQRDLAGLQARGAVLRNADFSDSRLDGACFDGANLSNARFLGASLHSASLRGADLEGTSFAGADLRGADFRDASLFGATFCETTDAGAARPARFDGDTQFDAAGLAALLPLQSDFLRGALRGGCG